MIISNLNVLTLRKLKTYNRRVNTMKYKCDYTLQSSTGAF